MVDQEYNSVCNSLNKEKKVQREEKENSVTKPDEKMSKDEKLDAKNIAERRVKLGLLMGDIGRNNNIDVSQKRLSKQL